MLSYFILALVFSTINSAPSSDDGFFDKLSSFINRAHHSQSKRCANLFDEGCANGGISSARADEQWLSALKRKRCAGLFDEGCINGGIRNAGADEQWLAGMKREISELPVPSFIQRVQMLSAKKCGYMLDDDCAPQGQVVEGEVLPGLHMDDVHRFSSVPQFLHKYQSAVSRRCLNLFDESCINGGIGNAVNDERHLESL